MQDWQKNIRNVIPYVPGDQPQGEDIIKLNTNENPYPPAPAVAEQLLQMDYDQFRKYPDPTMALLVNELALYHGVQSSQVFVGVGSDDVLAMAFMTFFNSEKPILFPDITYSFYPVWADLFRIPFETVAVDQSLAIKKEDYCKINGGIVLANPNAPTGLLLSFSEVEDIIRQNQDVVVIVDEAYIDFGGQSVISLVNQYANLLVVRTFSKSRSMAGIRIGYAVGQPELMKALNDVKYAYNSYTLNMPAILLGAESVKNDEYFKDRLHKIIETREAFKKQMSALGFRFPDSMTNFLFVTHPKVDAEQLYLDLIKEKIYVRHFKAPALKDYLRISIGTDQEMDRLCQFLTVRLSEAASK